MNFSPSWQWRIEALAAIGFMILGSTVWLSGNAIPASFMDTGFGAGLLPKWLGGALILLSLLLLIEAVSVVRRKTAHEHPVMKPLSSKGTLQRWAECKPYVLILLLILVLLNAQYRLIPFYFSLAIFIFTVIVMLEGASKRAIAIAFSVAIAMVVVIWVVFTQLFMVIVQ